MNRNELERAKKQAEQEFQHELFREAVEKHKQKLREYRPIWDRIFPWRILIVKKESLNV